MNNFLWSDDEIRIASVISKRNHLTTLQHIFVKSDLGITSNTIWNGVGDYPWPSVASQLQIVSTDANDTVLGNGARTIMLVGLDENFMEYIEVVSMNGINNVTTTGSFIRINSAHVITSGNAGGCVGEITITHITDNNIISYIEIGSNRSLQAVFTVPSSKKALIVELGATTGKGKSVILEYYAKPENETFTLRHESQLYQNSTLLKPKIPYSFPSKTDFHVKGSSDVSSTEVSLYVDLILIDNH